MSPILIDLDGNGFHLSSAENGVSFDINGNGTPDAIAWTLRGHRDALLCLDSAIAAAPS